jgi:hypothetical protein
MKKLILAVAALMVSIAAYGQGQFVLNNRIPAAGIDARIILPGDVGTPNSGVGSPDWTVSILGGPAGTPVAQLVPLEPASTTLRGAAGSAAAGYLSPQTVTVPNVAPNAQASILLRALGPGGQSVDFGPFNVTLGGGVVIPPNLALGNTPLVVPEPTTIALGALGLGALLLIRRRK